MRRQAVLAMLSLAGMGASPLQAQDAGAVIETRQAAGYGRYLTDAEGRSLYTFTNDQRGAGQAEAESTCYEACASAWPPMIVDQAPSAKERADASLVSTIERKGGERQATYDGWPLYYFAGDKGRGQATGQGVQQFGGKWQLARAAADDASHTAAASLFKPLQLRGPECVRYDAARERYLVSNINGKMQQADNNGYISVVTSDGIAKTKWIEGGQNGVTLNAPKGMELFENKLMVADIDHLRIFDRETGDPLSSIRIEGAKFLNDVATDADGTTYITDTGTKDVPGAIYRVTVSGDVSRIAGGRDLERPNGIDFDPQGRLVVVTFAGDTVMTLSTDGEVIEQRTLGAGQLDGLVVRDDGSALVASWKGKHIVRLAPDGTKETIATGLTQPAAFDVDPQHGRLLVPQVKLNEIAVLPLPPG